MVIPKTRRRAYGALLKFAEFLRAKYCWVTCKVTRFSVIRPAEYLRRNANMSRVRVIVIAGQDHTSGNMCPDSIGSFAATLYSITPVINARSLMVGTMAYLRMANTAR